MEESAKKTFNRLENAHVTPFRTLAAPTAASWPHMKKGSGSRISEVHPCKMNNTYNQCRFTSEGEVSLGICLGKMK